MIIKLLSDTILTISSFSSSLSPSLTDIIALGGKKFLRNDHLIHLYAITALINFTPPAVDPTPPPIIMLIHMIISPVPDHPCTPVVWNPVHVSPDIS